MCMITYYKLLDMLNRKGLKKIDLQNAIGCSPVTMASISKNKAVNLNTINLICECLGCQPGDILEFIPDEETTKKVKKL